MYIENPKTKGSGIKCVIPQTGMCPVGCADCFFQSGRSYLEPLADNLPNVPTPEDNTVYRINDGHDSSIDITTVKKTAQQFPMRFYNTSFTFNLEEFDAPVVLTLNPSTQTDSEFHKVEGTALERLMYVRFRVNLWNFWELGTRAIMHYAELDVPIVLTFMNYHEKDSVPKMYQDRYEWKTHVTNPYWSVKKKEKRRILTSCKNTVWGKWVSDCSGECEFCGNCLRLYFRKMAQAPKSLWKTPKFMPKNGPEWP